MSKLDDAVGEALSALSKIGEDDVDVDLLRKVTKGLGPSAYGGDGENVACSDKDELERVRKNYLMKKLGLDEKMASMESIELVCERMKPLRSHKKRSAFYYLLAKHHAKESVYDG